MFVDNPILIGGSGSSGTTLLSHLLNSHPEIHCGWELHLLSKKRLYERPFRYSRSEFARMLREGFPTTGGKTDEESFVTSTCGRPVRDMTFLCRLEWHGISPENVCLLAESSGSFKEFIDRFFREILNRSRKNRWAEKTPANCYTIGNFLDLYPSGRYVQVVRDGRDVVPSLMKKGISLEEAVRTWTSMTAVALPYRRHPRYYEIRYEDLVRDPEDSLRGLMRFLELSGEPGSLMERARSLAVSGFVSSTWGARPDEPIRRDSLGKWKRGDYPARRRIEQLFRHLKVTRAVAEELGLPGRFNANDILSIFGYDVREDWNPETWPDRRTIRNYLKERHCEIFHHRQSSFRLCLN